MEQKRVLLTGGARGIGRAILLRFARHNWDILCHYCSSEEQAKKLKYEIEQMGRQCSIIRADFRIPEEVEGFIDQIKMFHIQSLINNAGSYGSQKHFGKLQFGDLVDTFSINVFAHIQIASYLFSQMKMNHWGRMVNISSIAAKYGGSPYSLHYGCSKRALEGLTRTLAREGASCNILVNTIRPGVIDTDFHKTFLKDLKKRTEMIPLGKMGQVDDVADMVYYLGSDENAFITNEIITIAGGE